MAPIPAERQRLRWFLASRQPLLHQPLLFYTQNGRLLGVDVRFECKIVKVDAGVVDGWRGTIEDVAVPQVWVPLTRRTEARSLILQDTTSEFPRCAAVPQ